MPRSQKLLAARNVLQQLGRVSGWWEVGVVEEESEREGGEG
jgi:hypothetical protein